MVSLKSRIIVWLVMQFSLSLTTTFSIGLALRRDTLVLSGLALGMATLVIGALQKPAQAASDAVNTQNAIELVSHLRFWMCYSRSCKL